jgi:hypothetical protein
MSETINPDTPSSGSPVLHNQAVRVPAEMESTGAEAVSGQEGGEREGSIVEQVRTASSIAPFIAIAHPDNTLGSRESKGRRGETIH